MKPYQLLLISLVLASRSGTAQTSPTVPDRALHRWEIGAQLAAYPRIALAEASDGQGGAAYVRPWPVLLTVRYYTRPRVAMEAGLLLRLAPDRTTTVAAGTGIYSRRTHATTWAVPLLARMQLAPLRPQRWQIDAELGLMPLATKYSEETSYTLTGTSRTDVLGNSSQSYSDLPLVVGFGGNYRLTEHFGLTADARLTWSYLFTIIGRALTHNDDFAAPVTPALSAGVAYHIGAAR